MDKYRIWPMYRDVSNWVILNKVIIHDFGDLEMEIPVVNVLIGTLHYDRIGLDGKIEHCRTPITRWMTIKQFHFYNE